MDNTSILYKNILKIFHYLNIYDSKIINFNNLNTNNEEYEEINTKILINFSLFFMSNFKYKINSEKIEILKLNKILNFINNNLIKLNSKFLINYPKTTKNEFILISLNFLIEFDILNKFLDFIKKFESEKIQINFENLFFIHNNNNNIENDNLLSTTKSKSNSTIESFSKINFILKNIKKQINLLINLTYKLNELKNNMNNNKIINSLKIEESLILFNESNNLFEKYYVNILEPLNKNFISKYLENFDFIINLYNNSIEIFAKNYNNLNFDDNKIFNLNYNINNKNIKFNLISIITNLKIEIDNFDFSNFIIYLNNLEQNLNNDLNEIKSNQELFENDKINNILNKIAEQLQNFIETNQKDFNKLFNNFDDKNNIISNELNLLESFFNINNNNNKDLENIYINYLIYNNNIDDIFKKYINNIFNIINNKNDIISNKFNIFNNTNLK